VIGNKKRRQQKRSRTKSVTGNKQNSPFSFVRKIANAFSILTILIILAMVSIWIAGPHLFNLKDNRHILFSSIDIDSHNSKIYLAYFFPSVGEIKILPIESRSVEVLGNYGNYETAAVSALLKMEGKDQEFQKAVWSWGLGALIDQVEVSKTDLVLENQQQLRQLLLSAIKKNWHHREELISLLEVYFFARSTPIERFKVLSSLESQQQLEAFSASMVYEECLTTIVNTTSQVGLASWLSSVLEQSGISVIRVTDQNGPYQLSTFSYDEQNQTCAAVVKRAQVAFPGEVILQENLGLQREHRADLVIFIGEDLAKLLSN
jgi:hypothetical protein